MLTFSQTPAQIEIHSKRLRLSPQTTNQDSSLISESTHVSLEASASSTYLSLEQTGLDLNLSEHSTRELSSEFPGAMSHISQKSDYSLGTKSSLHAIAIGDQEYDSLEVENRDVNVFKTFDLPKDLSMRRCPKLNTDAANKIHSQFEQDKASSDIPQTPEILELEAYQMGSSPKGRISCYKCI